MALLRSASVGATVAYAGVGAVLLAMPDLSGVSGWPGAAVLSSDATGTWMFSAESSAAAPLCTEGRITVTAARAGVF